MYKIRFFAFGFLNFNQYGGPEKTCVLVYMYLQVLNNSLAAMQRVNPGQRITFVQDNCSIHRAQVVQDWFEEHREDIEVVVWASKSPDFNPIENLWAQMVRDWEDVGFNGVRERTVPQLVQHVNAIWHQLRNGNLCQRLVGSMQNRLQECIEAEGYYTRY